jgi:acetyl-CoA carboxylase biotin carboxylase subunit
VTELVTGVDIVRTGIRIAAGEPIPFKQSDVRLRGHAIECRINAEDPDRKFTPMAGTVSRFEVPGGPGVRVDTHCVPGYRIPPNYDSMIAKLLVHDDSREQAIARMARALEEFRIEGVPTTISLHRKLMKDAKFVTGDMDIHALERMMAK